MASPFDSQYESIRNRIIAYADQYGIDRNIAIWQIWQESRFNPRVCSGANACGIAQFIPGTAARFGVDPNDIESSLNGWGRYMSQMLAMFNGRIDIALAGYNSGENRNEYKAAAREGREINWSIMPAGVRSETQNYVKTIMRNAGASPAITGGVPVNTSPASLLGGTNSTVMIGLALLLFVVLVTD